MNNDTLTEFVTRYSPWVRVPEFRSFLASMEEHLAAHGIVELCLASEILHARWRLRGYLTIDETQLEPAARAELEKCRTRTANMVRRDSADLCRQQSERQIREQLGTTMTGLASSRELIEVARAIRRSKPPKPQSEHVSDVESKIHAGIEDEITKQTQSGPVN